MLRQISLHSNYLLQKSGGRKLVGGRKAVSPAKDDFFKCTCIALTNKDLVSACEPEWIPNGHITGRWKQPTWAKIDNDGDSSLSKNSPKKKASNCKKSLLPTLHSIVSDYYKAVASSVTVKKPFTSLQHLSCPTYFNPTYDLLHNAHRAVSSLLPDGDCEEFDVIKLAR